MAMPRRAGKLDTCPRAQRVIGHAELNNGAVGWGSVTLGPTAPTGPQLESWRSWRTLRLGRLVRRGLGIRLRGLRGERGRRGEVE